MALQLLLEGGAEPSLARAWLALLLTYALHALVWAAAVAWLTRGRALASAQQNVWFKRAVFGPLLSACFTLALPLGLAQLDMAQPGHEARLAWRAGSTVRGPAAVSAPVASGRVAGGVLAPNAAGGAAWKYAALGSVAAVSLGGLRWLGAALLLARCLRARRSIVEPRWRTRLEHLRGRMGLPQIALTECVRLGSPVVVGTAEICVPSALLGLGDAEVDSVLAHELAHIERHDGLWFPLVGLLQSALWLQPLNRWAGARFRQSAEEACDDRAVELTADAPGLARVLVALAAASRPAGGALVPTMASPKRALFERVRRLTLVPSAVRPCAPARFEPGSVAALTTIIALSASLSVQAAPARPGVVAPAWHRAPPELVPVAPGGALDQGFEQIGARELAAAASRRMLALAQQAAELEARIVLLSRLSTAEPAGSPSAVQLLELRQEQRHLLATRLWTEQRFAEQVAAEATLTHGERP